VNASPWLSRHTAKPIAAARECRAHAVRAAVAAIIALAAPWPAAAETRLLGEPDIHGERIAFTYAGDIWTADADGSTPRRLTVGPGRESRPHFSPDGRLIAFTGEYEGGADVYVIPPAGGQPRRLTFHPKADLVRGWTPDGQAVLFASPRHLSYQRGGHLFTVSLAGGLPEKLPLPTGWNGAYAPDGDRLAYQPFPSADSPPSGWKGYRGGRTPPIRLLDLGSLAVEHIPHRRTNDRYPMWLGERVYFVSDREGAANLWAFDPREGSLARRTGHGERDIEAAGTDGRRIVYAHGGRIHLFDPASGQSRPLTITLGADLPQARPRWVDGADFVAGAALGPFGRRIAFAARGEIVARDGNGRLRNVTGSSDAHDRDPLVAPDGGRIAYLSDAGGEYALHVQDYDGLTGPQRYGLAGSPGYYRLLGWSPDAEWIFYEDHRLTLYAIELDDGDSQRIDRHLRRWQPEPFDLAVSPDSRWIAYTRVEENFLRRLYLYDLEDNRRIAVTDGTSSVGTPLFSRDGRYLYFTASTNIGPANAWLDMSQRDRPVRRGVYAAVLGRRSPSPVPLRSDGMDSDSPGAGEAGNAPPETEVEIAGLMNRIVGVPVDQRDYTAMAMGADDALYLLARRPAGAVGTPPGAESEAVHTLYRYDQAQMRSRVYAEEVAELTASGDGTTLLLRRPDQQWARIPTGDGGRPTPQPVDLSKMRLRINPKAEWRQIFNEAWRIERDYFYDPDMHGVDWPAMRERYGALLEHVGTRRDLTALLIDMLAELRSGHARASGGDTSEPEGPDAGLLGADWEIAQGHYRVARIYRGATWNPYLTGPLGLPGIGVAAGDYLLEIDGEPLTASDNIHARLQGKAAGQVALTFGERPERGRRWEILTKPVKDERSLRLAGWTEDNRRRVTEATDGQVGYVYIPDTAEAGFDAFNRGFYSQVDRIGLIVDERGNRGGQAADYIVDVLTRDYLASWKGRERALFHTPLGALYGPKAMIIDQFAGSGGDFLPYAFRRKGGGPLVGTRSWGGLIGIGIAPELVDGGTVTAPYFRFVHPEGYWAIENEGVVPDIPAEITPAAAAEGRDPQLEAAIGAVLDALESYEPPTVQQAPPYPAPARQ